MTTSVQHYPSEPPNLARWLFPLLGLLIVAAVAVGMNAHSISRHGINEVSAIHNCLEQHGPVMTFRSVTDPNRFYQVCQLPDGRYGLRTVQHIGDGIYKHVTSFIKGNGKFQVVSDYLLKFANRFNGPLP